MTKFSAVLALIILLMTGTATQAATPEYFKNFSGYVRGFWSSSSYSYSAGGWDGYNPWKGHGGDGALNWHLPNGTDLEAEGRHWYASSGKYDTYGSLAALHWSIRNSQFLAGAFGGWESGSTYYDKPEDENGLGGIEGQYYLRDNITLYGQYGVLDNHYSYYKPPHVVQFAQVAGRYFWRDDTKIELDGSFFHASHFGDSTDENLNLWDYNAEIEHHFAGTPVGVFAGYDWWDHHDGFDAEGGDHTWRIGVKLSFGASSLREEDRNGATLKVVDFSPIPWLKLDGW